MEEKIKDLERRIKKLENDRKITGSLLGLFTVAIIVLFFK